MPVADDETRPNSGLGDGFSLLEMVAVVSLILILATFAMPIYHSIGVHAHEATRREDLFTLRSTARRMLVGRKKQALGIWD